MSIAALALSACSGYSFDINKNQVYTPAPIYTEYSLLDPGLQACIDQTIKDQKLTGPLELKRLQCSFSGIEKLDGLSLFSRIEQLSLKGNTIQKADELLMLTHLQYLDISDNPINHCATISQLQKLVTGTLVHDVQC